MESAELSETRQIAPQHRASNLSLSLSGFLGALGTYLILSYAFFGRALIGKIDSRQLGLGHDPSFLMWALRWWPYAISHRLNPFICRMVWAPEGFNLAWSGGIPLPSIVAWPLTAIAGPIASYNCLVVVAPALAASSAFVLCRSFVRWPAALIGGCVYGFSPYVLGQLIGGHLNLMLVFPAPLMVWVALRAIRTDFSGVAFAMTMAALFVIQFLCSIELAASVALFGAIALAMAWLLDESVRPAMRNLVTPAACSALIAFIVLSAYLYYLFRPGAPRSAINSPGAFSADLVNLIIPTRTLELGRLGIFQLLAARFPGNLGERDAYLGLPLLIIIAHYGRRWWSVAATRLLIAMLGIIVLAALGPRMRVAGLEGFGMPWKLALHAPLLKSALPARLMNYAFLVASIILALWLDDDRVVRSIRVATTILLVVTMLPNLNAQEWLAPALVPPFFTTPARAAYLASTDVAVALPFGIRGNSMLWQASSGMAFRMAGGYTGMTPRTYEQWPIVDALMTSTYIPEAPEQLLALMAAKGASVVIVDDAHREFWSPLLSALESAPQHAAGVWLYRPAQERLAHYAGSDPVSLAARNAQLRFAALIGAARGYLAKCGKFALLTPLRAEEMGLLPHDWVTDPDVRTNNGLYLGPWGQNEVAIGVVGTYAALQPLIAQYRPRAQEVLYPFPKILRGTPSGDTFMRLLVMTFKVEQLQKPIG